METATPRKRSAAHFDASTPTTARKRKAGIPTPNPPHAPFPTPTSTRRNTRRKLDLAEDDEDVFVPVDSKKAGVSISGTSSTASLDDVPETKAPSTPRRALPTHLQNLLSLHHAFNVVLSLQIAKQPPVLPPHPASTTLLQVPNLTNILAIRDAVERTAGRRFQPQELARLAWIWTWDGETLPAESSAAAQKRKLEDDNPFLVKPSVPSSNDAQVSGLSYLITTTRTLCPKTGRKVHTHGIGIELELQPGETRQVLLGGAEGGIGNQGVHGGLRVIGRWSAAGEMREDVVRQRLERWVELNGGDLDETPKANPSHLPTPTTRESGRSEIPPIPMLPLPKLPTTVLAGSPSARLFSAASSSSDLPLPPAFATPKKTTIPGLSDPFEFVEKKTAAPSTPKGSIEERRRAMEERIKARSQSVKANRTTLAGQINSPGVIHRASAAQQQEELRRRSTLSRLESIAEGVWMMFSAPSPGPNSLPSAPRGRRKVIPMREVAEMLVKSSKTPISDAEAQTSLKMLCELCPFFLTCKLVGKQEWLEMPPALTTPPSPGPAITSSPQSSPRAKALASPSLTGPASPGRVRVGGLQQVRERIRRELGEY